MGIPLRPSFSSSFIHVKLALFLIYLFLNWDFLAKMPIERSNVNNIVGRFEGKEKKEHFNAREGDSWAPIALSHIQDIFPKHSCGISSGLSATLGTMYTYEWVIWSCPWELTVLQVGLRTNDYWKKKTDTLVWKLVMHPSLWLGWWWFLGIKKKLLVLSSLKKHIGKRRFVKRRYVEKTKYVHYILSNSTIHLTL